MIVEIVVASIVCGTAILGYIVRLIFMSKCKKSECCTEDAVIHIERDTATEKRDVSALKLPL